MGKGPKTLRAPVLPNQACWPGLLSRASAWLPLATQALDRHGVRLDPSAMLGPGGTYPAVISGEVVIKFFGYVGEWAATWRNERLAQERLGLDRRIKAPQLLGTGELFPGDPTPLPYLVLSRITGVSWCDAALDLDQRLQIASDVGEQLRRVHALPPDDLPGIDAWMTRPVSVGAQTGLFPRTLIEQVDSWVQATRIGPRTFVHSDIFDRHPFVDRGRLSGIIDWGDAMAADPHIELGKLHLDVFEGDKRLLRSFLEGYGWPVDSAFPRRVLAMALRRHTQILGQHGEGGDMFYRVPDLIAGRRIDSLDDLAEVLFGV